MLVLPLNASNFEFNNQGLKNYSSSISLQIYLDDKMVIKSTKCECPRGAFKCSHAAALYIYGIRNLSRTDVECQWKKEKAPKTTQSATEMFPVPKKYEPLSRKPNESNRAWL